MCEGGLLLVCPCDVVRLWGLPLMLQIFQNEDDFINITNVIRFRNIPILFQISKWKFPDVL